MLEAVRLANIYRDNAPELILAIDDHTVLAADLEVPEALRVRTSDQFLALPTTAREEVVTAASKAPTFSLEQARFAPCLVAPEKIICVGLNYRAHAEETGNPIPEYPMLFNKFNNALAGHGATVPLPSDEDHRFDHEAELVIVMGREARRVSRDQALQHVFGYCVGNDLSARGLQFRTTQFLQGKSCDGFGPVGPWLVPAAGVSDPDNLDISCEVNGQTAQSSNTSDMIFDCAELVSYCSRILTLRPGDMIFTGTPSGVIGGQPKETQRWLRAGDVVTTRIAELGELSVTLG